MTLITTKHKQAPLSTIISLALLQKLLLKRNPNGKATRPNLYLGAYSGHRLHLGVWLSTLFLIQLNHFDSQSLWLPADDSSNHPAIPKEGQSALTHMQGMQHTGMLAKARWWYRQCFLHSGVHPSNLILLVLPASCCTAVCKDQKEEKGIFTITVYLPG